MFLYPPIYDSGVFKSNFSDVCYIGRKIERVPWTIHGNIFEYEMSYIERGQDRNSSSTATLRAISQYLRNVRFLFVLGPAEGNIERGIT
jgi:uncharacterized protein (UPF0248 family)